MVVGETCCVQTSCTILLGLHSICCNVEYDQTQRYSVMRPHRCLVFIVISHTLYKHRSHACHRITPWFINREICQITVNLNSLWINYDHFPSMWSPTFLLSGGSLGYWTACNNVKRYCTIPYCGDHGGVSGCTRYWPGWLGVPSTYLGIYATQTKLPDRVGHCKS